MVIIQEKLLLVILKRNLMRSWSYWSRIKSFGENNQPSIKDNEVLEVKPGV